MYNSNKQKHFDNLSVYGVWDDVRDYQFLVVWHPNGLHCDILFCSGSDYGGGVEYIAEGLPSKEVNEIIESSSNEYERKESLKSLCKGYGRLTSALIKD